MCDLIWKWNTRNRRFLRVLVRKLWSSRARPRIWKRCTANTLQRRFHVVSKQIAGTLKSASSPKGVSQRQFGAKQTKHVHLIFSWLSCHWRKALEVLSSGNSSKTIRTTQHFPVASTVPADIGLRNVQPLQSELGFKSLTALLMKAAEFFWRTWCLRLGQLISNPPKLKKQCSLHKEQNWTYFRSILSKHRNECALLDRT